MLALFSYIGFESATAMGSEARDPLRAIPRAVILTAILSGVFFTVCAYTEVLGLGMAGKNLGTSDVPLHVLASIGGMPVVRFIDRHRRAGEPVCRNSGLHDRCYSRVVADGP